VSGQNDFASFDTPKEAACPAEKGNKIVNFVKN